MPRVTREIPVEHMLSRQMNLWEMRRQMAEEGKAGELAEEPWHRGYIAISRQLGSLGNDIAERVAALLGWEVFDRELVHQIATSTRMRTQVIESLDEKGKDAVKSWVQGLIDSDSISSDRYCYHLIRVLTTISQHGRAVIVGRGANFVLDPRKGVRVRVIAPESVRIQRVADAFHLSLREARKRVRESDNNQIAFIRQYFHRDVNDADAYDLIINTEFTSVEAAARAIRDVLIERYASTVPDKSGKGD